MQFEKDKLTVAYSPVNFLYTGTYGVSPSNTTLTVRYLTGGGVNSNVSANTLNGLSTINSKFNQINLNATTANYIFGSLSTNNPDAASGGRGGDTLEEIRQNTLALVASQKLSSSGGSMLIPSMVHSTSISPVKPKLKDGLSVNKPRAENFISLN